jgi:hypothetical protein
LSAAERRSIDEVTQAIATTATLGTDQYAIVAIAAIPIEQFSSAHHDNQHLSR